MRIIGCDLHARQQTVAMLDTTTGEVVAMTLTHEGNNVRDFYSKLPRPVRVGIEATGSMQWFVNLLEELGIECLVGHPAQIRAAEPRKQKHDRRDANLILKLLAENRFPAIWLPSKELQDLRSLLRHRHQWVRLRTRIQNALQSIALANGLRRGTALWSHDGQSKIASLPLAPHTAYRRSELQALYEKFEAEIEKLNQRVEQQACGRPGARLLMIHPGVGPVTALATEVFLGDPARFADSKALASYVGMIPREYSSGERQRLGGLSKQGNPLLRFLWGEAGAHAARKDPVKREHPPSTERISLTKECGWKDGDRGGLAEWQQTHGKKKAKYALHQPAFSWKDLAAWFDNIFREADHPCITDELGLFNLGSVTFSFDLQFVRSGEHHETLGIELLCADFRGLMRKFPCSARKKTISAAFPLDRTKVGP